MHSAVPVAPALAGSWRQVTAGLDGACGVTTAGAGYCWGRNYEGQVGMGGAGNTGGPASLSTPTPVAGGMAWALIQRGFMHTCGVTTAGETWCWGNNVYGQLGDGTDAVSGTSQAYVPTPRRVQTTHRYVRLLLGDYHTCGETAEHVFDCWGFNGFLSLTSAATPSGVSVRNTPFTISLPN